MNKEISVNEAAKLMQEDEVAFLDVREHAEVAICKINGALHIPMAEIPERIESMPRDRKLIVYCHHGMRSRSVVDYLCAKGLENVINMTGGIHTWSLEVDPQMAQY
ncbi:MAG: rhodanese-like domain-containing protein [Opitutales bacterium]|jgi:rhodanese-related sulfurtransferase